MMPKKVNCLLIAIIVVNATSFLFHIALHNWPASILFSNVVLAWICAYRALHSYYKCIKEKEEIIKMHNQMIDDLISNYELRRKPNKIDVRISMN